jgi:hypothetical protein
MRRDARLVNRRKTGVALHSDPGRRKKYRRKTGSRLRRHRRLRPHESIIPDRVPGAEAEPSTPMEGVDARDKRASSQSGHVEVTNDAKIQVKNRYRAF